MSEKKDSFQKEEQIKKPESNSVPEIKAWIFKEKELRDLESRITDTLKRLNSKITSKEIRELLSRVEVSKWLDWLKNELEKTKKLWWKEISEDLLKTILELIKESKEITQNKIEELKIELNKLNESKFYEIDKKAYITSKFPWIKRFEESELWKNVIIDITWIWIGLLDSAEAVFKLLLSIVMDVFLLPRDLANKIKGK